MSEEEKKILALQFGEVYVTETRDRYERVLYGWEHTRYRDGKTQFIPDPKAEPKEEPKEEQKRSFEKKVVKK